MTTEQKSPVQVLQEGRARLTRGWCVNALALDEHGNGCAKGSADPAAVKWCAIGALGASLGVSHAFYDSPLGRACTEILAQLLPGRDDPLSKVVDFNNETDQLSVLDLFDRAIDSQRGYGFAMFRAATLTALDVSTEAK